MRAVEDGVALAECYPSPCRIALDQRGPWWQEFLEDLGRYRAHHGGSRAKALLLEQGLWALLQYRWASGLHRATLPTAVRVPALLASVLTQKLTEIVTGIALPFQADIHAGQYIGHFGPTVVNAGAVVLAGCNISQGVAIGVSGRGARRGAPTVGPRAYLGANAVVAGRISIGADCVVSANSTVVRDVADGSTAQGVPAAVVASRGARGMGLHQQPVPETVFRGLLRKAR